jgi:RHS repeat-associated protein
MVTDETGTPLTSVTYYPFGRTNECTGSSQSYLFIGKEEDATGLYYFNQRYYDPETGRFITRDPYTWLPDDPRSSGNSGDLIRWLITPQRFDGYSYAENNPVRYSDSTGLSRSLQCCDNQGCMTFCADDDATNSNPGVGYKQAEEASKSAGTKTAEEASKTQDSECDEVCQRKKAQEKCKEDCMNDEHARYLVRELDRFDSFNEWFAVGWALTCIVSFTLGLFGALVCGAVTLYAFYEYERYRGKLMKELEDLGCLCALTS